MALRGLYDEATASGTKELEGILRRYEEILAEDPTNVVRSLPSFPSSPPLD